MYGGRTVFGPQNSVQCDMQNKRELGEELKECTKDFITGGIKMEAPTPSGGI